MANYNVDDILDEVRRARGADTPDAPETGSAKPQAAPFCMPGMTDEWETPKPSSFSGQAAQATRLDIPVTGTPAREKTAHAATRVMEPLTPDEAELSQRRQNKVNQFMQHSFAAQLSDEEDDDGDDGFDLSSFFGSKPRLSHGAKALSPDGEEEETNPPARRARRGRGDDEDDFAPPQKKRRGRERPVKETPAPQQDEAEPEDAHEYRSRADAAAVRDELAALASSLRLRLIVTGVCLVLSLYLSLCNLYPLPLFSPICPENNMTLYLVCCLVPLLVSSVVSYPVLGNGVIQLFSGRAAHDTPAALCVLAVLGHTVALLASGSLAVGAGGFYTVTAVLTLFANTVGKRVMVARIARNFAVASADSGHVAEFLLQDTPLVDRLMEGQGFEEPAVAFPEKAAFPEKFLTLSYSPDYSDLLCRIACPLLLAFGAVSSLLAWLVFKQGAGGGLTVFCAMMCVASALTETLVGNLPLWRAAKALSGEGAFIAGYASSEEFEDMNGVAVDANELYPSGSAVLHGIKAFAESRIDEAILDAASIMCSVDGVLKDVFLDTIGGRTSMLKPVTDLVYEEQRGLCAEVGGQSVLIGNRDLMECHGVSCPSHDYEAKFVKGNRDILYLANGGEVTAMFVLSYRVSRSTAHWLGVLAKKDLSLIVHSTDPNITAKKIAEDYGYPEAYIRIVPAELRGQYLETTAPKASAPAWAMTLEGSRARLRLLAALHTLRQAVKLGTVLQVAGLVFGYALVAFLAFFGSIGSLGFLQLLFYQLFWTAAALLIPMMQRF